MLSREISVSSNLVSYQEGKPARFLERIILYEAFRRNFWGKLDSSLCYHTISVRNCWIFSVSIFSFSFKHSEHLLLLVLYAWRLPRISYVMFALRLLSFILQNSLDSSVSDLRFLWLNDFLWFAYLSLNVVWQIP